MTTLLLDDRGEFRILILNSRIDWSSHHFDDHDIHDHQRNSVGVMREEGIEMMTLEKIHISKSCLLLVVIVQHKLKENCMQIHAHMFTDNFLSCMAMCVSMLILKTAIWLLMMNKSIIHNVINLYGVSEH